MTIFQSIAVVGGSAGATVLMGFIFKWINKAKLKSAERTIESLTDQNYVLTKQKESLQAKVDQMNRERVAGASHLMRLKRSQEETKVLMKKIDKAHTDDEILELMSYIDEDNNEVLK
jgi:hypothetical protein